MARRLHHHIHRKHSVISTNSRHIHSNHNIYSHSTSTSNLCASVDILRQSNPRRFSTTKIPSTISRIADGVLAGNRRDLSRAITLVESTNPAHYLEAQYLLSYLFQKRNQSLHSNHDSPSSFRIGITGPPGAGKSTFVNQLGSTLCDDPWDKRVAVLPIDPSSFLSGGSILGDQTRMLEVFKKENAFVRPSPNRLSLGGVTDTTFEVCTLCESAGYDTIFVETVGLTLCVL